MKKPFLMMALAAVSASALAKLPAPVLDDAAKAKAEETKAKTAHAGKVDGYKLCLAMERAAANHFKTVAAAGKLAKPAQASPACTDPGPFVWPAPAAAAAPSAAAAPAAAAAAAKKP
ncbi:MAG: hypothetical protein C0443_06120 [Comamonadaceae bacterium]|nr:hypothetical protein [Comamonadaceae bacterium]